MPSIIELKNIKFNLLITFLDIIYQYVQVNAEQSKTNFWDHIALHILLLVHLLPNKKNI